MRPIDADSLMSKFNMEYDCDHCRYYKNYNCIKSEDFAALCNAITEAPTINITIKTDKEGETN